MNMSSELFFRASRSITTKGHGELQMSGEQMNIRRRCHTKKKSENTSSEMFLATCTRILFTRHSVVSLSRINGRQFLVRCRTNRRLAGLGYRVDWSIA